MKIFNLSNFWGLVKEAMGAPRLVNKKWDEQYVLWNVEDDINDLSKIKIPQEVSENNFPTWTAAFYDNAALPMLATEAKNDRQIAINETADYYGLPQTEAAKICKTFVAYKPSHEGYIISIAPYISAGYRPRHVIEGAVYGFYLGTLSRLPMSPVKIQGSANNKVKKWNKVFENKLGLTPEDLKLSIRSIPDMTAPKAKRSGDEIAQIPSLDPKSQEYESYFQDWDDPTKVRLSFKNMQIRFNPKGFDKLLKTYVNPWYEKALLRSYFPKGSAKFYSGAQDRAEVKAVVLSKNKGRELSKEELDALVWQEKEAFKKDLLKNDGLMELVYKSTQGYLTKDANSLDPAAKAVAQQVKIPKGYDLETQKAEEAAAGVPEGMRGIEYKEQYVQYKENGAMPDPSDKCFVATFGAQEATGVRASTKQKEGNIKLLNEVWNLRNDPQFNRERTPADIAAIMNKKLSRVMRGKYTEEVVRDILNKIKANPTILEAGDQGDELEAQELSDAEPAAEGGSVGGVAIPQDVHRTNTLSQAINEARKRFSTAQEGSIDPHYGLNRGKPSQRAMEIFNTPYDYTGDQLKTCRIKALIVKFNAGEKPEALARKGDAQLVFKVKEMIDQGMTEDQIVSDLMNGKVPDTAVQLKKIKEKEGPLEPEVLPPEGRQKVEETEGVDGAIIDVTPGGEKVEVEDQRALPAPPLAMDIPVPAGEENLPLEERERRRRLREDQNRNASVGNKLIILATLKSLITIAEDLDNEGKDDAAEEVHNLIRKYQGRI